MPLTCFTLLVYTSFRVSTTDLYPIRLCRFRFLTPVFAQVDVEAEPISIDIAPATAITWDSQSGKTYEIQYSTDLENWFIEVEGIEGIEGTGETSPTSSSAPPPRSTIASPKISKQRGSLDAFLTSGGS